MKKARVILCQKKLGSAISENDLKNMAGFRPDFICFPEYFFVDVNLGNHVQTPENQAFQIGRIKKLSQDLGTVVIGGSMPEIDRGSMYNTAFVYYNGSPLGFYRKKNLFFAEKGKIIPGDRYKIFRAHGIPFGVLICADIFHDEAFEFMKKNGAKIIFSPTFSPYKNETAREKFSRDRNIYVRGAALSGSVIVKVCGVKSEYRNFLQARSLIASKNRVVYRVKPGEEDREMIIKKTITIE